MVHSSLDMRIVVKKKPLLYFKKELPECVRKCSNRTAKETKQMWIGNYQESKRLDDTSQGNILSSLPGSSPWLS